MSVGYSNLYDTSGNALERRFVPGQTLSVTGHWNYTAALTSATNTTNTYYKAYLVPLPAGAQITDITLFATDSDSGATTTANLGDGTDSTRFFSAVTTLQAGGVAGKASCVVPVVTSGVISKGIGFTFTAADDIIFTIQTGSSGSATSGTIGAIVEYYCNPSFK